MFVYRCKTAHLKRIWTSLPISLAFVLVVGGLSLRTNAPGALAQSGNAALLADLRGQIQRYGCNKPQYATSVAGCRILHARVKTLQSPGSASRSTRQPYTNSSRYNSPAYSSRRTPRPSQPPSSSGGGFFGSLFGGGGAPQGRNTRRYSSYGMSYQGLNGWSSTYPSYMRSYGRYRTLCVRTCDGYYYPVSFSTTRSGIARDASQCESSCQVPAKLFYHRNPGADVQHMVDLQGKPYVQMENAFRYREEYVPNCRCKPEPWSEAAKKVYQSRAEQDANPGQPNTKANAADANGAPAGIPNGYAYPANPRGYYPRPAPRRRSRTRYRANDPEHTGRWWAGSW